MSLALRVIAESLAGLKPVARQPLGVVHLRLVGLYDESLTISVRAPNCGVEPGAPQSCALQLFCTKAQLDALVAGECGIAPLRYVGSTALLEHLTLLLAAGRNLLAMRASHQAKHFAAHYRDDIDGPQGELL